MHVAFRRSYSLSCSSRAKIIAGRRYPPRAFRSLHNASISARSPIFPWGGGGQQGAGNDEPPTVPLNAISDPNSPNFPQPITPQDNGNDPDPNPQSNSTKESAQSGFSRRSSRSRKHQGIPPIFIPEWFLDRNVKLSDEFAPLIEGEVELTNKDQDSDHADVEGTEAARASAHSADGRDSKSEVQAAEPDKKDNSEDRRVYRLNRALMAEVIASLSGSLSMTHSDSSDSFASGKSHLKLYCPIDGGTYFLEKVVEEAASQLSADIIRLDAQDLAEIAGDYIKEGPEAASNSLWSLGYDAQPYPRMPQQAQEAEDSANEAEEDKEDYEDDRREPRNSAHVSAVTAIPISSAPGGMIDLSSIYKKLTGQTNDRGGGAGRGNMSPQGFPGLVPVQSQQPNNNHQYWNDFKLNVLLETMLEANTAKRRGESPHTDVEPQNTASSDTDASEDSPSAEQATPPQETQQQENQLSEEQESSPSEPQTEPPPSKSSWPSPKTVVLVRAARELSTTHQGRLIMEKLMQIVQKKRRTGQQIMLVGTASSAELTSEISRSAFETVQGQGAESFYRTMVITPDEAGPSGGLYYREDRRRIREINVRHLHDMIRRFSSSGERTVPQDLYEFSGGLNFGPEHAELSSMLEEQVFSFDEVHRIALTALGNLAAYEGEESEKEPLQPHHIVSAMNLLDESDEVKTQWARDEQELLKKPESDQAKQSPNEARLKKLRKGCNHHEKTLLRGVVNPENIRTTFKDVHAPPETIDTLKNLTSLSLTRPEAFKYGVLATDKITGLLLYGPPGTGKTLLARAVAKQSGATVLEVSGSDVYDMYVGESEKNVRAIFSLAKKLSPCVVFIDEADAIFASRGSGTNRNSHRELINQFLREWDGMTDTNAFIMVATNRPFDLDDAALRRLPRRLLVDLPVEKDREDILKIHLKDEQLAPEVSLAKLAADTPLYSGSDLKNVAVAAALAAVREENDAASRHNDKIEREESNGSSEQPNGASSTSASSNTSKSSPTAESGKEDIAKPGEDRYVYPERRTLRQHHFEKAMEEITSSVSDDMSSLGAIRKFDEKYGDKRGKKKRPGYGFTLPGGEPEKDAAKIRSGIASYLGVNVALELTRVLPISDAVTAAYNGSAAFTRSLQKTGSSIVVEEDIANAPGRVRITDAVTEEFKNAIAPTGIHSLTQTNSDTRNTGKRKHDDADDNDSDHSRNQVYLLAGAGPHGATSSRKATIPSNGRPAFDALSYFLSHDRLSVAIADAIAKR
ncbi:MAG: hypothetical protein M1831_001403 [Alyxoria varia]|nr:MAG: hypothetical protein M1831_001403 [Alyxoria varia]